jgi:lysophospholipase L1-like esterase
MLTIPFHCLDKDLFYRPKPDSTFTMMIPQGDIIKFNINSLGFRGDEFSFQKRNNQIRIICMGDSSTFGFNLNLEDTYEEKLKKIIYDNKVKPDCEIINAGVIGYSSYQGLLYYKKDIEKMKPDILIFSFGANDSTEETIYDVNRRNFLNDMQIKELLYHYYKTCSFICDILHKIKRISNQKPKNVKNVPLVVRVSLDEYKRNLEKLILYCKDEGTTLIFLPISIPVSYSKIMQEVAYDHNIGFIDMEEVFKKHYYKFISEKSTLYKNIHFTNIFQKKISAKASKSFDSPDMDSIREWNYLFMDSYHPTPCGNLIIAEELYKYIIEHGILKSQN